MSLSELELPNQIPWEEQIKAYKANAYKANEQEQRSEICGVALSAKDMFFAKELAMHVPGRVFDRLEAAWENLDEESRDYYEFSADLYKDAQDTQYEAYLKEENSIN